MTPRSGHPGSQKTIKLHGIVTRGIGRSTFFTEIPWVRKQFAEKLGITPYPGTFNIAVVAEDREKLNQIREANGIEIMPEDKNFCAASSFPALINRQTKGAVIIPRVADYPETQLELISADNIKESLSLKDGDQVEVEVYL